MEWSTYLQSGQQPVLAAFVAAVAVAPNTASTAAVKATSFVFIVRILSLPWRSIRHTISVGLELDLKVKRDRDSTLKSN